jgi:serine phosphatase RsbU (regulator of sigma subunit)
MRVKELDAPARRPLGMDLGGQHWAVRTEPLEPGDRILMFSDGVIEARSPSGEFFGLDRLVEQVGRAVDAGLTPAEGTRRLVHALLDHQQGRLQDDATIVLLQWKPAPQSDRRVPAPVSIV